MWVVGLKNDRGQNMATKVKLHVLISVTFTISPYCSSGFAQYPKMRCPYLIYKAKSNSRILQILLDHWLYKVEELHIKL